MELLRHLPVLLIALIVLARGSGQQQQYDDDEVDELEKYKKIPETESPTFYMDKSSDCNGPSREVGSRTSKIYGRGPVSSGSSPLECSLTLMSDQPRDPRRFRLHIQTIRIDEDFVSFYIFDGESSQSILESYNSKRSHTSDDQPYRFTTGNKVTFKIVRKREDSNNYAIDITAEPVRVNPDSGWGDRNGALTGTIRKFPNATIVALTGAAFAVVVLISTCLLVAQCVRGRQTSKWKEHKFLSKNPANRNPSSSASTVKPLASYGKANGEIYFKKASVTKASPVKSRMAFPSEDVDNVFDDDLSKQQRSVNMINGTVYSNRGYNDSPSLMAKKMIGQAAYHKAYDDSADHDHPQEALSSSKKKPVVLEPDSDEEVEKLSIGLNTDPEMTDHGVQCDEFVEEKSAKSTHSHPEATGPADVVYTQLDLKSLQHPSQKPPAVPNTVSNQPKPVSEQIHENGHPSRSNPLPTVPYFEIPYSDPALRYNYPNVPYKFPRHFPASSGHRFPSTRSTWGSNPTVLDTNELPVYSYLVNRGYTPLDPNRYSPDSSATGTSHHSDQGLLHTDDSELSANLESGIEFMKR